MTMGQLTDILVPHIGDFDAVEIIEIAVQPGDRVKPEDTLLTLESEKATMDIPSPAAGTVRELMVNVGDAVAEGTLILKLEAEHGEQRGQTSSLSPDPDDTTEHRGQTSSLSPDPDDTTEHRGRTSSPSPDPDGIHRDTVPGIPGTGAQDPDRRTDHRLKCILQGSCQSGGA